jgi:integrase
VGIALAMELLLFEIIRQIVPIDGSLQRVNGKLERSDPKTETSRRILPMPAVLAKVLREHLRRLDAEREKAGDRWEEHGLLFPTLLGTPLDPRNLLRHLKSVLEPAGLPATTGFHDLRHWCASLLIAYKVHPKAIQAILGHANIQITMDTYGHLLPSVLQEATDQMGALTPPEETEEDT